jgi:DNA-binding transcriptional ArsR family regulator
MASEHLRLMRRCGFLSVEKDGRRAYYTIAEPHLASIMSCIEDRFGGTKGPRAGS